MNNIYVFLRKYWKIILCFISLIIFYYFMNQYFKNELGLIDEKVYSLITFYKNDIITFIMKFFTTFCSTLVLILITIATIIIVKNKKYSIYIGFNLVCVYFLNTLVKIIVKRPRPEGINLINENGFSFPSGHAMVSTAFYGLVVYIIYHSNLKKKTKNIICLSLSCLILLIGISRIYLGVHFASDVIAGFALGCAYLMLFISIFYRNIN